MLRTRICKPGEIAPPWKTPLASTRSYVIQEPASMASTALPGKRRWAATAFAARSMPRVSGVSYALRMGSGDRASMRVTGASAPSSRAAAAISAPTEATPMRCGTRPARNARTQPISSCGERSTRTGRPASKRAIFTRVLPTSMISSMRGGGACDAFRVYSQPVRQRCPAPPTCTNGALAQLVEQRIENPCVPSSILGGTTQGSPGDGASSVNRHAFQATP